MPRSGCARPTRTPRRTATLPAAPWRSASLPTQPAGPATFPRTARPCGIPVPPRPLPGIIPASHRRPASHPPILRASPPPILRATPPAILRASPPATHRALHQVSQPPVTRAALPVRCRHQAPPPEPTRRTPRGTGGSAEGQPRLPPAGWPSASSAQCGQCAPSARLLAEVHRRRVGTTDHDGDRLLRVWQVASGQEGGERCAAARFGHAPHDLPQGLLRPADVVVAD